MLSIALLSLVSYALAADTTDAPDAGDANQYTQYPSVAKTASVNGFADRLLDAGVADCAADCLRQFAST
ncbi:Likely cell surface antigen, partial [Candida maltosa Xu316]